MIVSRYGLHVVGGVPFLLQPRGTQNLISPSLRAPLEPHVKPRSARCPHDIQLTPPVDLPAWIDHPLVRIFHPTPRGDDEPTYVLHDPDGSFTPSLVQLERLSAPVETLQRPIWWRPPKQIGWVYGLTNLGPLVWTAATLANFAHVERHADLGRAYGRRVLIVMTERLPLFDGFKHLEPVDIPDVNFEAIGATLLRRHMETIQNG